MEFAKELGCKTIAISCNRDSETSKLADIPIEVVSGPEVLTGSTRLKAGTAQKLVCNMLSTASMVGIGKVYGNLMVDLQPTNEKLVERAKRMIMEATDCSYEVAGDFLNKANQNPKIAIVMILSKLTYNQAVKRLEDAEGFVRKAI